MGKACGTSSGRDVNVFSRIRAFICDSEEGV